MRRHGVWRRLAAVLVAAAIVSGLAAPAAAATAKKKKKKAQAKEPPAVPRAPDPYRVTIRAADGVLLAATWRPNPNDLLAPALLLVHDFSRDRRSWNDLTPTLLDRGFATLAVDLRGHGESTRKEGGATVKLSPTLMSNPWGFPVDVEAACRWLRLRSQNVGVLGLSLGGNLAVLATASRWADAGVAVSANVERLAAIAGSRPTRAGGLLALAAQEDAGRAVSAKTIMDAGDEPKKVVVYPGSAHNLALFDEHPEAREAALAWLMERLGPKPSPTPSAVPTAPPATAATPTPAG